MTQFTLLGTGTSTGVPSVACECDTCNSTDVRDKRLRTSLLVKSDTTTIVIDTSLDFRQQMLRHRVMDINAVLFTHHHYDHIGGFDDIRPFNFRTNAPLPVYASADTIEVLRSTFPYAFGLVRPTGASVPRVDTREIGTDIITIGDITVTPIPLLHGGMDVLGFRIGDVAYCTDTNEIPTSSLDLLQGLEVLVLDGLRWESHPTHFTVDQAIAMANVLRPKQTYLTHIAHQVRHIEGDAYLPSHVRLGWDNLTFSD